jgi:hypothetical protein
MKSTAEQYEDLVAALLELRNRIIEALGLPRFVEWLSNKLDSD